MFILNILCINVIQIWKISNIFKYLYFSLAHAIVLQYKIYRKDHIKESHVKINFQEILIGMLHTI